MMGTDVDVQDVIDQTTLHLAALGAKLEAGQLSTRLWPGADSNARAHRKMTPLALHNAARKGHARLARMLLEGGAVIDTRAYSSGTSLHLASLVGKTHVVRVLLEYGADDVNARDLGNETPSELASRFGQQEVPELLSTYGSKSVAEWYLLVDSGM
jgi:ankyrin repeat protein